MTASVLQEATTGSTSEPNLTKAFTANVTAGSTLHVFAGQGSNSGVTYTFTDNNGGSYTNLDAQWNATHGQGLCHAIAPNHPGGATTVTVTFSQNVADCDLIIREIGGVTASPLDGHTIHLDTASTTPSASATNANEPAFWSALCLNLSGNNQPSSTDGTSGITLDGNSGCKGLTSSELVSTDASQTATFSGGSDVYLTAIAIFDAAAPAGAALAGGATSAASASGDLEPLPGGSAFAAWNVGTFGGPQRRVITAPTLLATTVFPTVTGTQPCGVPLEIFPIAPGTSGSFTLNDCGTLAEANSGNQVYSIAASAMQSGVLVEIPPHVHQVGIVVSSVPAGGEFGISWKTPGLGW